MSRRPGVNKHVKQEMDLLDYDEEEEDEFEQNYTEEQWEQVQYLATAMNVTVKKAANALDACNFDENSAFDYLTQQRQREDAKLAKKKDQEKKVQDKKQQKLQKKIQAPDQLSKHKSADTHRRPQLDEIPSLNPRKSSYIVQDYQKDHYNIDYPNLELKYESQPSKTLNIVVVGHVDSGKSTLVGKLLHLIEEVSSKQIHKNEKQSREMGKQSFKYAWITDQTEQERVRGVTIDVGIKKITLKDRNIVFLDSPGHRDFIPNMITGAAQADYAILVVDVTHFDSTFISGGQTKEHAYIVKSLGVQTILIAVNKMDVVDWNVEAFQTLAKKLNYYLWDIGFKQENIIYVPISAFYGTNIDRKNLRQFKTSKETYKKPFLQILQQLPLPVRPVNKPLRVNITNFYDSPAGKIKGHCITGKIEGGVLKRDEKLVILPQDCQCVIKEILLSGEKVKEAVVGDNVDIQIKLIDETYFETIRHGNVLSSLNYSVPVSRKFVMEAMALQLQMPILKGTSVMAYIGSNKATARITKINCKYDPKTGTVIKKNCKSIRSNDCVEIQVETEEYVCIEKFSNFKTFGRVILRQKNHTLCVGTVTFIK